MKTKLIIILSILLLILPIVSAQVSIQLGEPYVNIDELSEIDFTTHSDYYEICSLDNTIIPVLIKNKNKFEDTFRFEVDKEYASLSVNSAVLKSGKSAVLLLTIRPPGGMEEDTTLILDIITEKEALKRSVIIKTDIRVCYLFELNIDKGEHEICGCDKEIYNVVLQNNGESTDTFVLTLDVPDWVNSTLKNDTIRLYDGQKKEFKLEANPYCDEKGTFTIDIKAISDKSGVILKDELELTVLPQDKCYNTIISADNVNIDYFGKNVPIVIENKGAKDVDYSLSIEGIDWYALSQTDFSIKQNGEKTINLALYPGEDIVEGEYNLDIKASGEQEFTKSITVKLGRKGAVFEKIGFYVNYAKYYIGVGVVLLVVILLLVALIRKRIKKKGKKKKIIENKVKEGKKVEEKKPPEEKKEVKKILYPIVSAKPKLSQKIVKVKGRKLKLFEYIYLILVIVLFLAIAGYIIYRISNKPLPVDKFVLVKDFFNNNSAYFVGGIVLLVLLGVVINFVRKKRKNKKSKKVKEKKTAKKLSKKTNKHIKNIITIITGLIVLSGIIYSFVYYGLITYIKDFFVVYYSYILMGVGLSVILILILHFHNKKIS